MRKKFNLRSGNKTSFKKMGCPNSPMKYNPLNPDERRAINNPEFYRNMPDDRVAATSDYAGMYTNFNQDVQRNANVEHLRRDNFERNSRGKLTVRGKIDKKNHERYLANRRRNPRRSDVERNRSQSQLLERDIRKGYSQIMDPFGNYHIINRSGNLIGGRAGYSAESRAWRDKYSLGDQMSSSPADDISISDEPNVDKPKVNETKINETLVNNNIIEDKPVVDNTGGGRGQNARVTTNPDGSITVIDNDTNEILQENLMPEGSRDNLPEGSRVMVDTDMDDEITPAAKTFAETFRENRDAGKREFEYDGKRFTTRTADESVEDFESRFNNNDDKENDDE